MRVEHTIKMDLGQHQNVPTISVLQCDTNTRVLHLFLYSNGTPWNVPEDTLVALAYIRSDGSRGIYDTMPDGSSACRYRDNEMFATIVPQAISTVGETKIVIVFTNSIGEQLASFAVSVNVLENPAIGAIEPECYINLQQAIDESVKEAISKIGASSLLVINISLNEENEYESDKNGNDIQNALESEKIVFCQVKTSDSYVTIPLVEVRYGKFYFGSIVNHYEWLVVLEDVVDADYNVKANVTVEQFDKSSSGETPYIGGNGNWWIGEEDTGVKASGEDGRSVYSVELDASQSDEGKSVYSMTDDGDRTIGSFTVYHGKDGGQGPQGPQGEKGDTGVYVGTEAPDDSDIVVWVDPDGHVNDCVPNPTIAEVGQTIVVKSVDENGKPTEWEAADMASGGGWKLFDEAKLTEEVRVIDFGSNSGGESFPENQELYVYMKTVGCDGNTKKHNVMLVVASDSWRLNEAIWNDPTTKICTGVWLMKPADTPSVVGIGVKNASVVTHSPYTETFDGYITGLRIYVETTDVPFGVGTIIKIYGR